MNDIHRRYLRLPPTPSRPTIEREQDPHDDVRTTGMSRCLRCVQARTPGITVRTSSSLADQFAEAQKQRGQTVAAFRTSVQPAKQSKAQEGMFYTVPQEEFQRSLSRAFSKDYTVQLKTFQECSLMVRRPALEVISYIKQANYKHVPHKYLIYGNRGVGKTMTQAHIMHHCATDGWMIVHFPWPYDWNVRYREVSQSSHEPSRIDLPVESVEWLKHFRKVNQHLINEHQLTTKYRYEWSKREILEPGSSWNDLIDHGIARPKYSSDCIGAILKEVRGQSATLPCKTLLVVDGINSFWAPTKLKDENHKNVPIHRYSLVHNIKKMFKNDWTNGAILACVDMNIEPVDARASFYPRYLLGKEGFELLDPYIPIHVQNYDVKELTSCLDYYTDRLWIQSEKGRSDEGRKEMAFISEGNPWALYNMCAAW